MKISLNWLQDFVTLKTKDPDAIARRITAGVAEVDDVEILGGLLNKCCVGKVLTFKKHPNADRLNICQVATDDGEKTVVCGGTNLREGMRVAFAHVGATVRWHGDEMVTLAEVKIRGVESAGMICAAEELDLASRFPAKASDGERPIIDLGDSDDGIGAPLKEYLGLDDVVLHIDNHAITHRADLFSHMGFAREFVALGLATWKKPAKKKAITFTKAPVALKTVVDCKDLVPRYSACMLSIDGLGETPDWMRKRLEATGWRSVSLPVDITNYVAMETGMPLHSFDADDIRGTVHMRTTKKGEKITTLDEVERPLPDGAIVLSDDDGIFDLLGIMGGLRSSTKPSTRNIYLHAAIVDPVSIRKAIIATGHRTDASTVYEKGVPRVASLIGLVRAVELFTQLVPGCRVTSKLEQWGTDGTQKQLSLPLAEVDSILGITIPPKTIEHILTDLEFTVKKTKTAFTVTVPPHRGDIHGARDLTEEVGRVYGYNDIPDVVPVAAINPPKRDMRIHALRDALKEHAFTEIVPISLVGSALLQKAGLDPSVAVEIRNPIGEELKLLHTSTLPGLLEHAQRNLLNASGQLRTFHLANVFTKQSAHKELGILITQLQSQNDGHALLHEPVLQLSSVLRQIFHPLGYEANVAAASSGASYAHPGRTADIFVRTLPASNDTDAGKPFTRVGMVCDVHPSVASSFDLPHRAAVALIDVDALLAVPAATLLASPVPQFPAVSYDQTETMRDTRSVGELLRQLRGSHEFLESVVVKDLYRAPNLPKEEYNLTLTFTYRAKDRTLTEDEAKGVHQKVLHAMMR